VSGDLAYAGARFRATELTLTQVVNVITSAIREPGAAALTAEVAAMRAQVEAAALRPAQHLHLHGVSPDANTAVLAEPASGVQPVDHRQTE
jgi:hypothetical protein